MPVSIIVFKFACLSNIIRELLPFKEPINLETLKLGGMLTRMWMWSGNLHLFYQKEDYYF